LAKRTAAYKQLELKFPDQPDSITYYLNKPHRLKVFDYDKGARDTTISTMDSIRYMERFMHAGFVAMEPQTGHVKAWVATLVSVLGSTIKYYQSVSRAPRSNYLSTQQP
jgi:penicillin-binding protein 1A